MAKTKIESALKMLNLFIIPTNRDSHWSRRGAARSEENLFICHRDWSDSIDCLIDLFLHLICDARAATRNVTGASASASPIDRSIDRASSIPVGVQVKLSAACGTWRSCLRLSLSPVRSCALRRGSNYVDCVPCDFIDRLTEPNRSTPLIRKKFAMQRMKIDLMIARAWSTTFLSDRRKTRPQIRLYVDNVSVCAARCSLAGRTPLHCEREFPCERCEELR